MAANPDVAAVVRERNAAVISSHTFTHSGFNWHLKSKEIISAKADFFAAKV